MNEREPEAMLTPPESGSTEEPQGGEVGAVPSPLEHPFRLGQGQNAYRGYLERS